jgi:hypothetical protein
MRAQINPTPTPTPVSNEVNDPPQGISSTIQVTEDTVFNGTLTATDPENDPLTYSVPTPTASPVPSPDPRLGTLSLLNPSTGTFRYTPKPNKTGTESIKFVVSDGKLKSAPATLTINIAPIPDSPVAQNGTLTAIQDTTVAGTLRATTVDSEAMRFEMVSAPSHGVVHLPLPNSPTYSYRSSDGYVGSDSFTFRAYSGTAVSNTATVTITIKKAAHPLKNNTLVLYNLNASDSEEIARHYIRAREFDDNQLCAIRLPAGDIANVTELLGARRTIVEQCICPLIPEGTRPRPCNVSNVTELAKVSPITHLVAIRGIPHRLIVEEEEFAKLEKPVLDVYLGALLYRSRSEAINSNPPPAVFNNFSYGAGFIDGLYGFGMYSFGSSPPNAGYDGPEETGTLPRPLSASRDRMAVVGRIDGISKDSAKALIDRTVLAEQSGITGNIVYTGNGDVDRDQFSSFLFDSFIENPASCREHILNRSLWPYERCRVGGTYDRLFPGTYETTIPRAINVGMYWGYGLNQDKTFQHGFNQRFYEGLLNWRKSAAECTPLCKDFPTAEQQNACRSRSTDFFREINSDCVGMAPGAIGHQMRSYNVMYFGILPPGWDSFTGWDSLYPLSGDFNVTLAPTRIAQGGYQDTKYRDTSFIRFGGKASGTLCTTEAGQSLPCAERLPIRFGKKIWSLVPLPQTNASGFSFRTRLRLRNPANPSGAKIKLRIDYWDPAGAFLASREHPISLESAKPNWRAIDLIDSLPLASAIGRADIRIASGLEDKLFGYLDLDAIELTDLVSGAEYVPQDIGSFSAPYLDNLSFGDFAANAIERMGAVAWWGSSSHFQTLGHAYEDSPKIVGAFLGGRSLGESVFLSGGSYSGTIYGDPIYSPVAARIFMDDGQFRTYPILTTHNRPIQGADYTEPGYIFHANVPEEYNHKLYLSVLHGRGRTRETRWKVDHCEGLRSTMECDARSAWSPRFSGTGTGTKIPLPMNNLLDLVSGTTPRKFFLRLKVWNPGQESNAIYNIAAFEIPVEPPPPLTLSQLAGFLRVKGGSWNTNYSGISLDRTSTKLTGNNAISWLTVGMNLDDPNIQEYLNRYRAYYFDDPTALDGVSVRVVGANRTYTVVAQARDGNQRSFGFIPSITTPEKLLIEVKYKTETLRYRVNIIPGVYDPTGRNLTGNAFQLTQTDVNLFDQWLSYVNSPSYNPINNPPNKLEADINGDGKYDQLDRELAARNLAAGRTQLPAAEPAP